MKLNPDSPEAKKQLQLEEGEKAEQKKLKLETP
mgnify:CR=1 FL=1